MARVELRVMRLGAGRVASTASIGDSWWVAKWDDAWVGVSADEWADGWVVWMAFLSAVLMVVLKATSPAVLLAAPMAGEMAEHWVSLSASMMVVALEKLEISSWDEKKVDRRAFLKAVWMVVKKDPSLGDMMVGWMAAVKA